MYIVEVIIDKTCYANAKDFSIKGAEQLAAEKAWNAMTEAGLISNITE
jgi:dsRNA-specific ribonuclease